MPSLWKYGKEQAFSIPLADMKAKAIYWMLQCAGWGGYLFLAALWTSAGGTRIDRPVVLLLLSMFAMGISTTHLYRILIIRLKWLDQSIAALIPRVLAAAASIGLTLHMAQGLLSSLLIGDHPPFSSVLYYFNGLLVWTPVVVIWSLVYFAYHFFKQYRSEEIKNLELESSQKSFALNRLKSQMNPHFIFNSMNSIRALVDEDPAKAKQAITRLSNILRHSLTVEKKQQIPLEEELSMVKDYLSLEKARYEERLTVKTEIDPAGINVPVPPMMVLTLVENGIKHGISKLKEGGQISLTTSLKNGMLWLWISNPTAPEGTKTGNGAGFGLRSTRERLALLYGDQAGFELEKKDGRITATINIPFNNQSS